MLYWPPVKSSNKIAFAALSTECRLAKSLIYAKDFATGLEGNRSRTKANLQSRRLPE